MINDQVKKAKTMNVQELVTSVLNPAAVEIEIGGSQVAAYRVIVKGEEIEFIHPYFNIISATLDHTNGQLILIAE